MTKVNTDTQPEADNENNKRAGVIRYYDTYLCWCECGYRTHPEGTGYSSRESAEAALKKHKCGPTTVNIVALTRLRILSVRAMAALEAEHLDVEMARICVDAMRVIVNGEVELVPL